MVKAGAAPAPDALAAEENPRTHLTLGADHQIILGCGLVVVIYVTAAGLLGAVYSDVPQFIRYEAPQLTPVSIAAM